MKYLVRKKQCLMIFTFFAVLTLIHNKEVASSAERLTSFRNHVIIEKGTKYSLMKEALSSDYKSSQLKFSVANKQIATINSKGVVRAKKAGSTKIKIKDKKSNKKKNITVKVVKSCTEYTVKKGKTTKISTILTSHSKTENKKSSSYKWTSRNKKIVVVSKDGSSIQGKKKGTTYLEGSTSNGKENKILLKITVGTPAKLVKIYGSEYTIGVGSKQKLNYTVLPKNSSNKGVYYKLSKRGVISITSTGIMKALKPGEVSVAICSNDGKAETVITVMVVAELTRNTIYGKVKGTQLSPECVAWFGVPYAKSPTGDLRWRAPQELNPWNGVLSAKTKKAKAAQAKTTVTSIGSEDCLYTNIYRPNNNDTNLPVMVFLHGGSNISGNANRNFKNFAASTNCIVVAVSYRLGAFGWLNLEALKTGDPEEDSGNFALLDIKKALQWVQSNIGYFGGNPGNVTLSGFSAGARNTLACVISPIMKGLFHKVISFSGGMTTATMDDAQSSAESKLAGVLVKRGVYETRKKALAWVEAANNDEIKALLYSLTTDEVACMYTYMGLKMSNAPQLFADGYVLPSNGFEVIGTGNYNMVPMMFGSSSQEFATYALSAKYMDDEVDATLLETGWKMLQMIQNAKTFGSMYQSYFYVENNIETFSKNMYQTPMYAYRFDWGNDSSVTSDFHADFIGSSHGLDVNFLCGAYKNSYENYVTDVYTPDNLQGRRELTATMQAYIGNFLKNGDPNGSGLVNWNHWNPTQGTNKLMIFNASKTKDISQMSSMYYSRAGIENQMDVTLTGLQKGLILNKVLAGRFFMPIDQTTLVPDEDSEHLVEDAIDIPETE